MATEFPDFRLGSVLATSFTGTLSERCGEPVERIPTPGRLADWLDVNGLPGARCTEAQLVRARQLREAIHQAATAVADGNRIPEAARLTINDFASSGGARGQLTPDRNLRWRLRPESQVDDALGVIAVDAIAVLSGARAGKLARCASPTCRAAFFDTSRSRSRRWCDMNTCGNREKKARFRASHGS